MCSSDLKIVDRNEQLIGKWTFKTLILDKKHTCKLK